MSLKTWFPWLCNDVNPTAFEQVKRTLSFLSFVSHKSDSGTYRSHVQCQSSNFWLKIPTHGLFRFFVHENHRFTPHHPHPIPLLLVPAKSARNSPVMTASSNNVNYHVEKRHNAVQGTKPTYYQFAILKYIFHFSRHRLEQQWPSFFTSNV